MSQRMTVHLKSKPCYDIMFEADFKALSDELALLDTTGRRVCIVTDTNVEPLYADSLTDAIKDHFSFVTRFVIPAGEENKTLDEIRRLYAFLIEAHFDRKDYLIALGGGVIGDMTGYAAATYLRGIDFIQIPTTLLACTDSSIGGKTGVDFDGYKNMVGAFKMPRLVYMNLSTLKTLEPRQYYAGFAETMKHALIKNAELYEWLISNMYEILDRDEAVLEEMIVRSCDIKRLVVEKDPTEKGDRALLNFGHTIGHAIEKYCDFKMLHGECVALGCVAAAYISYQKGMLPKDDYYEVRDMFVPFKLPISIDNLDVNEIVKLTKSDKKMDGGTIKFVLLKKVGKAVIDTTVTDEELIEGIKEINFDEDDHE